MAWMNSANPSYLHLHIMQNPSQNDGPPAPGYGFMCNKLIVSISQA